MTPDVAFAVAQRVLQDVGWVLLQLTAVLVLSYLLFFAGSLIVAALHPTSPPGGRERRASESRAPTMSGSQTSETLHSPASPRSLTPARPPR